MNLLRIASVEAWFATVPMGTDCPGFLSAGAISCLRSSAPIRRIGDSQRRLHRADLPLGSRPRPAANAALLSLGSASCVEAIREARLAVVSALMALLAGEWKLAVAHDFDLGDDQHFSDAVRPLGGQRRIRAMQAEPLVVQFGDGIRVDGRQRPPPVEQQAHARGAVFQIPPFFAATSTTAAWSSSISSCP